MFCSNCGSELKEGIKFCPNCGAAVNNAGQGAVRMTPPAGNVTAPQPNKPMKKTKKKMGGVLVFIVCLAILAGLAVFFYPRMHGFIMSHFASAKDYYRYVEKKNIDEFKLIEIGYNALRDQATGSKGMEIAFDLGLTDAGKEEIEAAGGSSSTDLSWINSMGITYKSQMKDEAYQVGIQGTINDAKVDAFLVADTEDEMLYVSVPVLSDSWISAEEEYISDLMDNMGSGMPVDPTILFSLARGFSSLKLPEYAKIDALIDKYTGIYFDHCKDVEKDKDVLKEGNVKQKCTKLTVTMDGEQAADMIRTILDEAMEDKTILDLIDSFKSGEISFTSDNYVSALEELLDSDKLDDLEGEMIMELYVDSANNIVGRDFYLVDDSGKETMHFSYKFPRVDKKYAMYVGLSSGETELGSIKSSGKISGDDCTGDLMFFDGKQTVTFGIKNFNFSAIRTNGNVNGMITLDGSDMADIMQGSSSGDVLSGYSVTLDYDIHELQGATSVDLSKDKDTVMTVKIDSKMTPDAVSYDSDDLEDAADLSDSKALQELAENIKYDSIRDVIKKAGLPEDMEDEIISTIDGLEESGGAAGVVDMLGDE